MDVEKKLSISLVVPVKNEEDSLSALFESISSQVRKPDEVIFVDAGSEDKTAFLLKEFQKKEKSITVISGKGSLPGEGRNIGVNNSKYEWIAFTDAGIKLDSKWLYELEKKALEEHADIVYGHYEVDKVNSYAENYEIAVVTPPEVIQGEPIRHHSVVSLLITKQLFKKVGGFPASIRAAEDRIFMKNADREAKRISFASRAVTFWTPPLNDTQLWQRFYLYSCHDILAGEFENWHKRVYQVNAGIFFLLFLAFWYPVFFIGIFFILFFRVKKRFIRNNRSFELNKALSVLKILLITDFAAFAGHLKTFTLRVQKHAGKEEQLPR